MYLISIYFDEKTNRKLQRYINKVAEQTGNTFMLEVNVPPHITISAFETIDEQTAIDAMNRIVNKLQCGLLEWVSVGQFFPYVIFLSPVLNEYLHKMSVQISSELEKTDGIKISPYYRPFHWLPHTTIGKTLSKEEMKEEILWALEKATFEKAVLEILEANPGMNRETAKELANFRLEVKKAKQQKPEEDANEKMLFELEKFLAAHSGEGIEKLPSGSGRISRFE